MVNRILCQRSRFLTATLMLGLGLIWAHPATGQTTWYVDDDAVNDPGPGTTDVSDPNEDGSPEHPFDEIQEGIDAAVDGDTVLVLDGIYVGCGPFPNNCEIDLSGKAITVRSENGPGNCIITCPAEGRAFYIHNNETADTVVDGFTILHGDGDGTVGGGIRIDNASPTFMNCVVSLCSAEYGAGVYCVGGSPTFIKCDIVDNQGASGIDGFCGLGVHCIESNATFVGCTIADNQLDLPWVRITGAYFIGGMVEFTDCVISGHSSSPDGSSGIHADDTILTINSCIIADNVGMNEGGGVYCSGYLAMRDSTISGNWGSYGGGVHMTSGIIENCIFEHNGATGQVMDGMGGGIRAGSDLIVNSCQFYDNGARSGGGIYASGTLFATNNIFANNASWSDGNAIYCRHAHDQTIHACTFAGNTSSHGYAVCCNPERDVAITNSIFWDNQSHNVSGVTSVSYCDVQGGWPGIGNIDSDPLFVDPDADDFHLSPGSPCINAGTNYDPNKPALDIDGEARIQICRVDIGADESPHQPPLTDCNVNDTDDDCDIFDGVSSDDNENHIPDECEIPTEDPNDAIPGDDGDPNVPVNGNSTPEDPNNSSQIQKEDAGTSLPCCGSDACGPGALGWMPLSILALGSMKTRRILKR